MSDDPLLARIDRFERTVATCLCVVPVLFAAQCFFAAIACPVFQSMFADFGARLPALTELAMRTWPFWAAFAVIVPIVTFVVSRKSKPAFSLVFTTASGVVLFAVAQTLTVALFLPIIQLGAVAGGPK